MATEIGGRDQAQRGPTNVDPHKIEFCKNECTLTDLLITEGIRNSDLVATLFKESYSQKKMYKLNFPMSKNVKGSFAKT